MKSSELLSRPFLIVSLFLLSFSSISFEILASRYFSISLWGNLSFFVISIAMFGFAGSGLLLAMRPFRTERVMPQNRRLCAILVFYSASGVISYLAVNALPIEYYRLPSEPIQFFLLACSFVLLSAPFFFSGLASSIAYGALPEKSGMLYFAAMAGSALGALLPFALLPVAGLPKTILISALIPSSLVLASKIRLIAKAACAAALTLAFFLVIAFGNSFPMEARVSPYKSYSQILQFPDTKLISRIDTMRGRLEVVKSPAVRHAPGLSLMYSGGLPEQTALIRDCDDVLVLYSVTSEKSLEFAEYTLPFCGYALSGKPERVLVIQKGGGAALACAMRSWAPSVAVCEDMPEIASLVSESYAKNGVYVIPASGRDYLYRQKGSYDVIQIDSWGASLPGMFSLNEEFSFTKEAFALYIRSLSDSGVLIISRRLLLPPQDSLRLSISALYALSGSGIPSPEAHLVLVKSWDVFSLIVSRSPIKGARLSSVKDFCARLGFDLLYYDGMAEEESLRFVKTRVPVHYRLLRDSVETFKDSEPVLADYILDVAPVSDDRPYHNRYIKWDKAASLVSGAGGRSAGLVLSGDAVVFAVVCISLVFSAGMISAPVALMRLGGSRSGAARIILFMASGAGFMLIETSFIRLFSLPSGDHVISFGFTLASFLFFSGLGGFASQKISLPGVLPACAALVSFCVPAFFFSGTISGMLLSLQPVLRYAVMGALIAPCAFACGIPFPVLMRLLPESNKSRALFWAANGSASVLASVAALPLAMSFGNSAAFLCAGLCYALLCIMVLSRPWEASGRAF